MIALKLIWKLQDGNRLVCLPQHNVPQYSFRAFHQCSNIVALCVLENLAFIHVETNCCAASPPYTHLPLSY